MFGDIPIDFVGGILNTESPMWDVEPGGIWVMDPNQPPSAFNLLSPGNGSTLSITPDNVQDVLTFSWEPSIDPEGDQVEYMFATIPSFVSFSFDLITIPSIQLITSLPPGPC
jgi:hypothetical protein